MLARADVLADRDAASAATTAASRAPVRVVPSVAVGPEVGGAADVATGVADRGAPGAEAVDDAADVFAERLDHGSELTVGRPLDLLAGVASGLGHRTVGDPPTHAETFLGGVELGVAPRARAHVRARRNAHVHLGEQAELRRVDTCRHP